MNLLLIVPITVILLEWTTRHVCPENIIRPSNLIISVSKFIGSYLYYFGTKFAFLLDYMNYIHILKNLGKILKNLLINIEYYVKLVFRKIYKYTPLRDIFTLLNAFIEFVTSFGQFFVGYDKYYQKIIRSLHLEGYMRRFIAFCMIGSVIFAISVRYYDVIVNIFNPETNSIYNVETGTIGLLSLITVLCIFSIVSLIRCLILELPNVSIDDNDERPINPLCMQTRSSRSPRSPRSRRR